MSLFKKLLFTFLIAALLLIVPGVIIIFLFDKDATVNFSAYVFTYGFILFAIFSYIIISIHNLTKEMKQALEDMRKQNAAIAYRLTHKSTEFDEVEIKKGKDKQGKNPTAKGKNIQPPKKGKSLKDRKKAALEIAEKDVQADTDVSEGTEEQVDTSSVNLNPADPLMIDGKIVSDKFNEFK